MKTKSPTKSDMPQSLKKLLKQSGHKLVGIDWIQGERYFIISVAESGKIIHKKKGEEQS